jgi:hypothetical protein
MNTHTAVGMVGVDGGDAPLDGKTPANGIECVE